MASVGGSSIAVPDFRVALRDSSFWFSPSDSLGRVKLSSVGFGGCKRGLLVMMRPDQLCSSIDPECKLENYATSMYLKVDVNHCF